MAITVCDVPVRNWGLGGLCFEELRLKISDFALKSRHLIPHFVFAILREKMSSTQKVLIDIYLR